MLTGAIAGALALAAALFAIATWAERSRGTATAQRLRPLAYALALGTYCTSWSFYGAVGSASNEGWSYLPIYLGPALVFLLAPRFLETLVGEARSEGATTISDFIGSRFGKSRGLAALVTVTAALGAIPYIALQLRSVGIAFVAVSGVQTVTPVIVASAAVLACFSLLFGTRRVQAGGNDGLVQAAAFGSLVKLAALTAIGVLACALLIDAPAARVDAATVTLARAFAPSRIDAQVIVIGLLAAAAILCLPRQFHLAVTEARASAEIRGARLPFILYLAAIGAVVVPITLAGAASPPAGAPGDLLVLALPLHAGNRLLTLAAFVGGLAAAMMMVAVETLALAAMVANDLVAPLLLKSRRFAGSADIGRNQRAIRRAAVVAIITLALLWALGIGADRALASMGLIAFAAVAQFALLLVLAVRRGQRDPRPAIAGLACGLGLWLYTLALPPVLPAAWLAALRDSAIDPQNLLGIGDASWLVHGVGWSLGINLAIFALLSARSGAMPVGNAATGAQDGTGITDIADLIRFVGRFIGDAATHDAFADASSGRPATRVEAQRAERLIAGVIGAPSARALTAAALAGERLDHDAVVRMLDASGGSLQFSKQLLARTLEHIDPGVAVLDRELRLVAWNARYLELTGYPERLVYVGAPIERLLWINASRGECAPDRIEVHVAQRLARLRRGVPQRFDWTRDDGRVFRMVGGPMPGGYVNCMTDITAEAVAHAQLAQARAELEARVAARTADLSKANCELAAATRDKTRFLAAASHDLLQPLHAARLFNEGLARETSGHALTAQVDRSIEAAERLLRALLDISKLDSGGIVAARERVALRPLLKEVADSFRPIAARKGLSIRVAHGDALAATDAGLLRSILHNLVSNAVRYTDRGGVLIGLRRRSGRIAIQITDTGHGIPEDCRVAIFREFERLGPNEEPGDGLGLAIVDRTVRLIGAELELRSVPGKGSSFAVVLPTWPSPPVSDPDLGQASAPPTLPACGSARPAYGR